MYYCRQIICTAIENMDFRNFVWDFGEGVHCRQCGFLLRDGYSWVCIVVGGGKVASDCSHEKALIDGPI